MTRDQNYPEGTVEFCRTDHISKRGQVPIMLRLHPEAGCLDDINMSSDESDNIFFGNLEEQGLR
jgi:hypothetical protein